MYLQDNTMLSGGTALVEKIQESDATVNRLREFGLWGNDDLTGAARQASDNLGKRIDRAALRVIYETNNGGSWKKKNNWLPSSGNRFAFSNWHGVKTSSNGRVSELELSDNNLVGGLTNALEAMHLVWLNLSKNRLTGEIPTELGNLTRLQSLDLHDNELTGDIPSELGDLTRLQYLLLYDNKLTGEIPSELGNLTRLTYLYLDSNKLTGEVPEFSESSRLFSVYLNDNNLSGNLPPGLPRSLASLVVSDNPLLSGTLPLDPMVHTEVSNLDIENTAICVPDTPEFQQWLMGISFFGDSGMTCGEEPPPPPGQVTGVSVTPGVLQLSVLWNAVSDADGYKVQWKSGALDFASTRQHTVTSGSTTTYTIPNLTADTPYTIRVIAIVSNADDGLPSSEILATPKATTPGQVTGVTVTPEVPETVGIVERGGRCRRIQSAVEIGRPGLCQHTPAHRPLRKHYNLHDPEPHRRHAVHDKSDSDCLQRRRRTAVIRDSRHTESDNSRTSNRGDRNARASENNRNAVSGN